MLDETAVSEIRAMVHAYFADECGVDPSTLSDRTSIIEDLDGDSLMMLGLLKKVTQRYGVTLPLRDVGRYLMRRPAETLGDIVVLTAALVEHGDNIVNVDL